MHEGLVRNLKIHQQSFGLQTSFKAKERGGFFCYMASRASEKLSPLVRETVMRGKKLTYCGAECVAEYTQRPLLALTPGDIGTEPTVVETTLQTYFKLGEMWGAIFLLDEADVYLEARSLKDLVRNSLVSGTTKPHPLPCRILADTSQFSFAPWSTIKGKSYSSSPCSITLILFTGSCS